MIVLMTNYKAKPYDERCQAFFNYPGIASIGFDNEGDSAVLHTMHNKYAGTGAMIVNCSEDVFVFDIDALLEFMIFLVAQPNCEVNGFTMKRDTVAMGAKFNIMLPKTHINEGYFDEAHSRKIDSFIAYERDPNVPGFLLLNHASIPFAIYAGQIEGEPKVKTNRDLAHAYAVKCKENINEWNKDLTTHGAGI
jgi:hypothetical protein